MIIGKRNERRLVGDPLPTSTPHWVVSVSAFFLHFMQDSYLRPNCNVSPKALIMWDSARTDIQRLSRLCSMCYAESEKLGVAPPPGVPRPDWYSNPTLRQTHYFDGIRSACLESLYHPSLGWERTAMMAEEDKCRVCRSRAPSPASAYYDRIPAEPLYVEQAYAAEGISRASRAAVGAERELPSVEEFFKNNYWIELQEPLLMLSYAKQLTRSFRVGLSVRNPNNNPDPRRLLEDRWYGRAVIIKNGMQHHPRLTALRVAGGPPPNRVQVRDIEYMMINARAYAGLLSSDTSVDVFILEKLKERIGGQAAIRLSAMADWYSAISDAIAVRGA